MPISIQNLCSGDQISYSLPLLVGEVQPFTTQGTVLIQSSYRNISWPVINGRFKILVELVSGINCLELKCGDDVLEFILHLKLPSFSYFVRPIYIKCREDAGEFQGPDDEDRSPNNAIRRISLAVRMLQTFTAEKLNDQGFGRRTFALETDINASSPPCHIFESQLTLAEAHSMSGSDLWSSFARELMSCDRFKQDRDRCKWFAFMSFTRYAVLPSDNPPTSHSEILSFTKGHTALGGGGLALIGTGTLHCWSQDVSEVVKRFTDTRRIDRTRFMDDSAYREFYWANYATGLGAALHELGHTFDLAHSPTGIMARGFDDINRFFIVQSCSVSSQSGVRSSPPHPASSPARVTSAVSTRSRTSSVGDGVPCSRDASPIPYSPKQSPNRRPSSMECGGGSPVFPRCHSHTNSRLSSSSTDEVNSVVIVESAFNRLHVQTAHTTRIKNYDGSDVITTTTRHKDGVETVSEATAWPDGRLVIHELVRNVSSGKTRKTTSMTVVQRKLPGTSSIGGFSTLKVLSNIPGDVPAANAVLSFQESRYRDGGAHWYRSSAVLLRYHKWFNPLKDSNSNNVVELDGNVVRCTNGIRLIELRYIPEGCVGHHWEFLDENPPTEFEVCIDDLRHLVVPDNGAEMVLLVEDDNGIILKRRVTASVLRSRILSTQ